MLRKMVCKKIRGEIFLKKKIIFYSLLVFHRKFLPRWLSTTNRKTPSNEIHSLSSHPLPKFKFSGVRSRGWAGGMAGQKNQKGQFFCLLMFICIFFYCKKKFVKGGPFRTTPSPKSLCVHPCLNSIIHVAQLNLPEMICIILSFSPPLPIIFSF